MYFCLHFPKNSRTYEMIQWYNLEFYILWYNIACLVIHIFKMFKLEIKILYVFILKKLNIVYIFSGMRSRKIFRSTPNSQSPKLLGSRTPNAQAPKIVKLPFHILIFRSTPNTQSPKFEGSRTPKPQKSPNSQLRLHILHILSISGALLVRRLW